jgi:riboflavin biosynthesis pyrimidine reductase
LIRRLVPSPQDLEGDAELEEFYTLPPGRHVRANFVVSVDGAVEIGGRSRSLGAPADRAAFMAMRAVADAVMVGAGTARIERYGPVVISDDGQARRSARDQQPVPPLVVVSRRGLLSAEDRIFSGGHRPIVVTTGSALAEHPDLVDLADVLESGEDDVDLPRAVDRLFGMGLERILCEGGPSLLHSLLEHDLVDEICVTFSPVIAGSQHVRLSGDEPLAEPAYFGLDGLLEGDGLLMARYGRRPEAQ